MTTRRWSDRTVLAVVVAATLAVFAIIYFDRADGDQRSDRTDLAQGSSPVVLDSAAPRADRAPSQRTARMGASRSGKAAFPSEQQADQDCATEFRNVIDGLFCDSERRPDVERSMVKLLSSQEGVRLISTAIDQADATILSRYINLIRWRCADAGCKRLDDAGLQDLPPEIVAAIFRAIREGRTLRAYQALEFFITSSAVSLADTVGAEGLSDVMGTAEHLMRDPDSWAGLPHPRSTVSLAARIILNPHHTANPEMKAAIIDAACNVESTAGTALLSVIGELGPSAAGEAVLKGLESPEPGTQAAAIHALRDMYLRPGHWPEDSNEGRFKSALVEHVLSAESFKADPDACTDVLLFATGVSSSALAYDFLTTWAGTSEDPETRSFLERLVREVASGTDRRELRSLVLQESPWSRLRPR